MRVQEYHEKQTRYSQLISQWTSWSREYLLSRPTSDVGRQYLEGRFSPDIREQFEIGLSPPLGELSTSQRDVALELKLYSPSLLSQPGGSIPSTQTELYFDRHPIIWPLRDEYGVYISLMGRALPHETEVDKYNFLFGYNKSHSLFGLHLCKRRLIEKGSVILVEGQIDAMVLWHVGLPAVALGGTSLSWYQVYLLKKYGVNKIISILDNDEGGKKGSNSLQENWGSSFIIDFRRPAHHKDVDEAFRAGVDLANLHKLL